MKNIASLALIACLFTSSYIASMEKPPEKRLLAEPAPHISLEVPSLKDTSFAKLTQMLIQLDYPQAKKLANEMLNSLPPDFTYEIIRNVIEQELAQPWTKKDFGTRLTKLVTIYLPALASMGNKENRESLQNIILNYLTQGENRFRSFSDRPTRLKPKGLVSLLHIGPVEDDDLTKRNILEAIENNSLTQKQQEFIDRLEETYLSQHHGNILHLQSDPSHKKVFRIIDDGKNFVIEISGEELTSLIGFEHLISKPDKISVLNIKNTQLTTIPSTIENLTNLQVLSLFNNRITALPPQIGSLTQLRNLSVTHNRLTTLPSTIKNLIKLHEFTLAHNQLTNLPPIIVKIPNLLGLYLNDNKIAILPPTIGNLTTLFTLDLRNNQLTMLPSEIGNLTKLQRLYLAKNRLTDSTFNSEILKALSNLTMLEILDLSGNQISPAKLEEIRRALPNVHVVF